MGGLVIFAFTKIKDNNLYGKCCGAIPSDVKSAHSQRGLVWALDTIGRNVINASSSNTYQQMR
jgi:hypothetical protein